VDQPGGKGDPPQEGKGKNGGDPDQQKKSLSLNAKSETSRKSYDAVSKPQKRGGGGWTNELKQGGGGGDNPGKEERQEQKDASSEPQPEEKKKKGGEGGKDGGGGDAMEKQRQKDAAAGAAAAANKQQQKDAAGAAAAAAGDNKKQQQQENAPKQQGGGGGGGGGAAAANKQQQKDAAGAAAAAAGDKKKQQQQENAPKQQGGGGGGGGNANKQQPQKKGAAVAAAEKKQQEDIPPWWTTSKKRFKQQVQVQQSSKKGGGKGEQQQQQEGKNEQQQKKQQQQADALWLSADEGEQQQQQRGGGAQDGPRLSRQVFIVCLIFAAFAATISFLVYPPFNASVLRGFKVLLSLASRLITGTKSSEYALEAVVCTATIIVLRFALQPFARRLFFWWTDSASDKAWTTSALYWVIINVYGPLELALVTVAGMRFMEAAIERFNLVNPMLLNMVVERLVVVALVVAFARVALSWQERYFSQKTFDLELEGKPLQAERIVGLNKLSNIATYLMAIALGLKLLGVDIGALVTFGGISGLAIGLAGRQILENAFMGLMLYATAPFMPGDEIKFSTSQEKDIEGMVLDIGLFRTTIKSFQREEYIVPNSLFSSLVLLNVTRKAKEWRIRTDINVRLADAPRVANMLTNYRSLLKSDDRVLRSLHRRVFLEKVTPEGLVIHISFYVVGLVHVECS
jgi:small-conductance mechanosensitive channel